MKQEHADNGNAVEPSGGQGGRVTRHHSKAFLALEGLTALPSGFHAKVEIDNGTGCWNWQGNKNENGYGFVFVYLGHRNYATVIAHRVSYRVFVGEILPGMHIDHLCFNPSCVNPVHLEQVTAKENSRRAVVHRTSIGTYKDCPHGFKAGTVSSCLECVAERANRTIHRVAKLDCMWALELANEIEAEDSRVQHDGFSLSASTSDNVRTVPVEHRFNSFTNRELPEYRSLFLKRDKLCRACDTVKPVGEFYTVTDYTALGVTTYPSARCKPCHNKRTAYNQRLRRRTRKVHVFEVAHVEVC